MPLEATDGLSTLDIRDTEDHFGQRTVNDIVVSCLATILACTWSAIHPNIPATTDCWWTRFKRQVVTMFYGLLAPEAILAWALRQRLAAQKAMIDYNKMMDDAKRIQTPPQTNGPGYTTSSVLELIRTLFQDWPISPAFEEGQGVRWTLTHAFFFKMGGFVICERGQPTQTLVDWDARLKDITIVMVPNIRDGIVEPPRLSEEDIKDRSKGNTISKIFTISQTTWFVVQCVARWSHHLPVTELEVVTLGFAMLNGFIYGLWWHKPQNVGRPVFLECRKNGDSDASADSSLVSEHSNSEKESSMVRELRAEIKRNGRSLCGVLTLLWSIPLTLIQAFLYPLGKLAGTHEKQPRRGDLRVGMFYSGYTRSDTYRPLIPTAAFGALFGLVHFIPGWYIHFSSGLEMGLWEIAAFIITIVPIIMGLFTHFQRVDRHGRLVHILGAATSIGLPLYCISRIMLLVLALNPLRSLSPATLRTVEWTTVMPHL